MTCVRLIDDNVERGDVLWARRNPGGGSMSVISVNRLVGYIGENRLVVPCGCDGARGVREGELIVEYVMGNMAFCEQYAVAVGA